MSKPTYAAPGNSATPEQTALRLFQLAAMLVGDESEAVAAVEAGLDIPDESPSQPENSGRAGRRTGAERVAGVAIRTVAQRDALALVAPDAAEIAVITCLDDDDFEAAGLTAESLSDLIEGEGRVRMRHWLEGLGAAMRTVFVLRAVGGFSSEKSAELLRAHAGKAAGGWTAPAVSNVFRQGLCSLTSQLVHSGGLH